MSKQTLIVVGSGPGIGTATAKMFAQHGFSHIGLISRNAARVQTDADAVLAAVSSTPSASTTDIVVRTYAADTGDVERLRAALAQAETDLGPPQVVLFNAARIAPTRLCQDEPDVLLKDFETMNVGLYVTAKWAVPLLEKRVASSSSSVGSPALLLSGGYVHEDPLPEVFSLCMQKAAQHNLMKSLHKQFGPKGVHFAVVNIGGPVTDEDPVINVANISKVLWDLAQEDASHWRHSVDVGVDRSQT